MSLPRELTHPKFSERIASQEQVADLIADNLNDAFRSITQLIAIQAWPIGGKLIADYEQHIWDLKVRIDIMYGIICSERTE